MLRREIVSGPVFMKGIERLRLRTQVKRQVWKGVFAQRQEKRRKQRNQLEKLLKAVENPGK